MTEYEVKCPQTWAWYTGYVEDYNIENKKLLVSYDNDWKEKEWVDIESVRDKFDLSLRENWRPSENEEVECKARAEEGEPYGWWACTSKKMISSNKGSDEAWFSVSFDGWGDAHNETLSLSFIRPKSLSKTLSNKNMYREEYDVPPTLSTWVDQLNQNGTLLNTLMSEKKISSQIVHIDYLRPKDKSLPRKLLLIGTKRVLITMKDIIYCIFKRQETIARLEKRTKEYERKSREKKEEELKAEKYTFNIHPLLSGYLRGSKGRNIADVQREFRTKGLLRIEPGLQSCCVLAKNKTTLKQAVDQLEIVCKKVIIPFEEMGQIIGAKGQQIQDIKKNSEVIKIISWEKWEYEFNQLHAGQVSYYQNIAWENDPEQDQHSNDWEYYNKDVPPIILNADKNNIFDKDDVIDLSKGYESQYVETATSTQTNSNDNINIDNPNENEDQNDALVIIGRRSRVDLCVFMIEMTLNHFRTITKTKKNVFILRTKINELKGNPPPSAFKPSNRDRRTRGRGRGRGNNRNRGYDDEQVVYDESKENSPQKDDYNDGLDEQYDNQQQGGYRRGGGGGNNRSGKGRGRGRGRGRGNRSNQGGGGRYGQQGRGGRRPYGQNRTAGGALKYRQKGQGNYNGQGQGQGQYDDYGDGDYGNYGEYDNNQENNNNSNQRGQGQGQGQGQGGDNKQNNKKGNKKRPRGRDKKKNQKNDGNKQQSQDQNESQQTEQPSTS